MTLYDLTKKYGKGKGEETMWETIKVVSERLEDFMDEPHRSALMREIYGRMSDGHYNKEFADEDIAKMYYVDERGNEHHAPYWTEDQAKTVYDSVRSSIPSEYNFCDFYVALNMRKSDECNLIRGWFPSASDKELEQKVVESTINFLNDEDNPYGTSKVWGYLHGKK